MINKFWFSLALCVAGPLAAQPWEEFANRCLIPAEQAAPADVTDLVLTQSNGRFFEFSIPGASLAIEQGADGNLTYCEVTAAGEEGQQLLNSFMVWSVAPENMQRYVMVPDPATVLKLQTAGWRTGPLDVFAGYLEDGRTVRITAREAGS